MLHRKRTGFKTLIEFWDIRLCLLSEGTCFLRSHEELFLLRMASIFFPLSKHPYVIDFAAPPIRVESFTILRQNRKLDISISSHWLGYSSRSNRRFSVHWIPQFHRSTWFWCHKGTTIIWPSGLDLTSAPFCQNPMVFFDVYSQDPEPPELTCF